MTITLPDFTAAESDAGAALSQYQRELTRELRSVTSQAINQWLKESDKEVRDLVRVAINELTRELSDALSVDIANAASGSASANRFSRAIGNLVVAQVNEALFSSQTSVNARETDRSQLAESQLRLSRSQQRAAAAREVGLGQRNL